MPRVYARTELRHDALCGIDSAAPSFGVRRVLRVGTVQSVTFSKPDALYCKLFHIRDSPFLVQIGGRSSNQMTIKRAFNRGLQISRMPRRPLPAVGEGQQLSPLAAFTPDFRIRTRGRQPVKLFGQH